MTLTTLEGVIIGIDPGVNGALAFLKDGAPPFAISLPILGAAGNRILNAQDLASGVLGAAHAYVEKAQVMRGPNVQMGSKSAFSYGMLYGAILAALAIAEVPYTLIPPQRWRQKLPGSPKGRTETKRAIERVVRERFPTLGKVKQDHLDAIFLAMVGANL